MSPLRVGDETASRPSGETRGGGYKMLLKNMTVMNDGKILTYSTLVDAWEDILAIAEKGTDGIGREIIRFTITADNGMDYTYTPQSLVAIHQASSPA